MAIEETAKSRWNFRDPLRNREIDRIAAESEAKVLQTSQPVRARTWRRIDERLLSVRPDIEIRVFGFYGLPCDLSFIPLLANVRRFSADCLSGEVSGLEAIAALPSALESLRIGILELNDFSFLESVTPTLRWLSLGATNSESLSLAPLSRFTQLETVYLEEQQQDIEVLSQLLQLRDVTLRDISTTGLDFLRPVTELRSLDLKLGEIRDLTALAGMSSIKYFEAWAVGGLSDLSVLSQLPGLQNLFLQELPKVNSLPSMENLRHLRRVVLEDMKGLRDLTPLESAPVLEEFALVAGESNKPKDLEPVLRNPSLKRVSAGFGRTGDNREFENMCARAGLESWGRRQPFIYV